MKKFALVGKPNAGKSSLFNLLTGLNQKIGNYSGVTVERKIGQFQDYEISDLPGIKTLRSTSPEEKISKEAILQYAKDKTPILFVANGMQFEDNLMLFSEIADLQIPCILLINFKDDLSKNKIEINTTSLSNTLGCPVLLMNSRDGDGLSELEYHIKRDGFKIPNAICRSLYDSFENGLLVNSFEKDLAASEANGKNDHAEDFFKRQKVISSMIRSSITEIKNRDNYLSQSKKWDGFLLHPIFGLLFFLFTLLIVFQSVFYLSGFPMDWIDSGFGKLIELVQTNIKVDWLASLLSDGIIAGLGGVLIFIPQIAILFFLLGLLEQSGYLSRISFLSNRFLSKFGLSGQSVVPLMSSWACTIPAIMSTRIINDPKERMAVIMASPLMTCSARLPVYTILIALIFPDPTAGFFNMQGVLLLGLYLLGLIATLLVALIVNKRSKIKPNPLWSLELPIYRFPNWRNVFYNMYQKTKTFVLDAGKIIFIVSIILWFLASFSPKSETFIENEYQSQLLLEQKDTPISLESIALEYSYAGYLGKVIEPVIKPLGYDWKIGIALLSSFAAREVFVGSLATIYSVGSEEDALIKTRLKNEINGKTGQPRFNVATCVSLLLFYVFALQCMSTVAIVRRETDSWFYPIFQFVGMFILAYIAALFGYHLFL